MACGILSVVCPPGIEPSFPSVEAQSLNYWTAWEVPIVHYFLSCGYITVYSSISLLMTFGLVPAWVITNKLLWTLYIGLCIDIILLFLWCKYLDMEWLDHIVDCLFTLKKLASCFPKMLHHFTGPPSIKYEWSTGSISLANSFFFFPLVKFLKWSNFILSDRLF